MGSRSGNRLPVVILVTLGSFNYLNAQIEEEEDQKQGPISYFNLGTNVNSYASELSPIVTSDGRYLYFVRDDHKSNWSKQDVWYSTWNGTAWTPAVHALKPINRYSGNSQVYNISADGNQLLVRGAFVDGEYEGAGVSIIKKDSKGDWKGPQKLEIRNYIRYSKGRYNAAFLTADGKHLLLYFSDKENNENSDLYVSHLVLRESDHSKPKDLKSRVKTTLRLNTWTEPEKIVSLSEKDTDDFGPFLAADGVTLYYASTRTGGYGKADIWMTRRLDDTWQKWSEPVNMGRTINSKEWEAYYSLDARGEYAYLSSGRNSFGGEDIIRVRLDSMLTPKPVMLLSGRVFNKLVSQEMSATIEYEDVNSGKIAGVAEASSVDGYRVVLPNGRKYLVLAHADGFYPISQVVDLRNASAYEEYIRNLFLVPLDEGAVIQVKGVFFPEGKSELSAESDAELGRIVEILLKYPKMSIEFMVYFNSKVSNQQIAEKRLTSIFEFFSTNEIDPQRVNGKVLPMDDEKVDRRFDSNEYKVEFRIQKM